MVMIRYAKKGTYGWLNQYNEAMFIFRKDNYLKKCDCQWAGGYLYIQGQPGTQGHFMPACTS